jgi:hypothetical protein
MKPRPLVLVALGLSILSPTAPAVCQQATRYRFELRTSMVQDLSAVGQGEQKQDFSLTGQASISTADSAGGQTVTVALDSLQASAGTPLPAAMIQGLVGSSWRGFRGSNGRVTGLKPATELEGAQLLEGALQQLFPPIPPGTKAGKSWTDTLDSDQSGVAIRTVTNFATSAETHEGKQSIRLAGASSSAISGVQESPQGSLNIEGTGTGTVSWLITPGREMISGTFSQDQQLEVSVPALPAPIPIKVHNEGSSNLIR